MKSHDKNNFVSFIVKNPKAEDIFKHCDLNKDKVVEVQEVSKCVGGYIKKVVAHHWPKDKEGMHVKVTEK